MSVETVRVPDIGSDDAVDVIEVSAKVGDQLQAEDTIVVLESDKATVEVPLPQPGEVKKLLVKTGDRVRQGDALLELDVSTAAADGEEPSAQQKEPSAGKKEPSAGQKTPSAEQQPSAEEAKPATQQEQDKSSADLHDTPTNGEADPPSSASNSNKDRAGDRSASAPVADKGEEASTMPSAAVHAGPAVRKLARELGVDLARVRGTGPRQRILQEDVHAWVKQALAKPASVAAVELPEIDFSRFGEVEQQEQSKLRRVAAANLHRSWQTIPHVTQHDLADITALEEFRRGENQRLASQGVKLTPLAFLVRACAAALTQFPRFNSSLSVDGNTLIIKRYIHIGVAVETENGLMVPVLRDANHKGVMQIASEVAELAGKARQRKLAPADMQGASFTVSSLGGIGGTAFTPIVNWPEVAILGVSKSDWQPRWNGKEFEPRLMLPLSLSYDHRVIDGADAARFITFLRDMLSDMRRALL